MLVVTESGEGRESSHFEICQAFIDSAVIVTFISLQRCAPLLSSAMYVQVEQR